MTTKKQHDQTEQPNNWQNRPPPQKKDKTKNPKFNILGFKGQSVMNKCVETTIDFGKAIEDKTKLGWKGYCLKVKPTSNTQETSKNAGRMFFFWVSPKWSQTHTHREQTHTHTHTHTHKYTHTHTHTHTRTQPQKKTKQTKQTLK